MRGVEKCAIPLPQPDVVITEKGLSDLAAHFLVKAGVSAIRRIRKTDNNRVARACGATILHRPEEIREQDVGVKAGLFEVLKIGDEFFTFLVDCDDPKACTGEGCLHAPAGHPMPRPPLLVNRSPDPAPVVLRGASKDILNEVERNLTDAIGVARNVCLEPKLVPGGGAVEMAVTRALNEHAATLAGADQWAFKASRGEWGWHGTGRRCEDPRTHALFFGTSIYQSGGSRKPIHKI